MPSMVIGSYSYDPETACLTIRYVSGLVYCYKEVPEKIFKEFRASLVKGRYLHFRIKGKYAFEKMVS